MKSNFFYQKPLANIYAKSSIKSEITSQILFGEKFKVLKKKKKWLKIKTDYDGYIGYLKDDKFSKQFEPSHKIYKLKTKIYKKNKKKFLPSKKNLFFGSRVSIINKTRKFLQFDRNQWIKKKDVKNIKYYEKNFLKVLNLFLGTKYLWGGKSALGIDCSALVQIFFFFNNVYFPRDTRDQIRFLKNIKDNKKYKKNILLYWKGHVAVCLNKKNLIHAYGPKKKVIIMNINNTIKEIERNAKLSLKII